MNELMSATEIAMRKTPVVRDRNVIPKITHPLGQHWDQPPASAILIDDTHAVMSQKSFDALHEYSATNPTGVYEGKMWKRHDGVYDPFCPVEKRRWVLCWFGFSDKPDMCSNNYREILIA